MGGGLLTSVSYIAFIPLQRRKIKADTDKVGVDSSEVTVRAAAELLGGALPWVEQLRAALTEAQAEIKVMDGKEDEMANKLSKMTQMYGAMRARNSVLEVLMRQAGVDVPPAHELDMS